MVYELLKERPNARILVCAPSNVATDALALALLKIEAETKKQIELVRLYASYIEKEQMGQVPSELYCYSIHNMHDEKKKKWEVEMQLLQKADVVCCTCTVAGDARLRKLKFDVVIIDECSVAMDPEVLLALVKTKNKMPRFAFLEIENNWNQ